MLSTSLKSESLSAAEIPSWGTPVSQYHNTYLWHVLYPNTCNWKSHVKSELLQLWINVQFLMGTHCDGRALVNSLKGTNANNISAESTERVNIHMQCSQGSLFKSPLQNKWKAEILRSSFFFFKEGRNICGKYFWSIMHLLVPHIFRVEIKLHASSLLTLWQESDANTKARLFCNDLPR